MGNDRRTSPCKRGKACCMYKSCQFAKLKKKADASTKAICKEIERIEKKRAKLKIKLKRVKKDLRKAP